ncbi:MAG TPA: helix-turn-helix transcriptional regulator [Methylocella sp.]|nr:helix-turn-helix transcriptional regulator [Methylocella sp.]
MSRDLEIIALINLIYEAVLDSDLWPSVLIKLADALGAGQIAMPSMDWRANLIKTIAPRCDPDLLASWQDYWAFHDPTLVPASLRPEGQIYTLDSLMPREEFAATPVFNEFWRPAGISLSAAGANLVAEDQFSAMVFFSNPPGKESLTAEQMHIFEVVLRHLARAVRLSQRLWELELNSVAAGERLEALHQGALLADASRRVVRANSAAKAMLDDGHEIFLDKGRLAAAGSDILQKLINSCARTSLSLGGPGGEFKIPRESPRLPLQVTVAPLRAKPRLVDLPWIGGGAPVAIIMIRDPDVDRRRQEENLRRRFGLTAAEARLAAEVLKGDGRVAAARRHGITPATARTHLSSIFAKTGTHRQAELIRLLLDAANEDKIET